MPDYVPALKAHMGDWTYYTTVMKLGKIAKECSLAEDIHTTRELSEVIQRDLQKRVETEMVPYLLNEKQRFYGALVVAVFGGSPDFNPVKVDEHALLDDTSTSGYGFGLLRFDGSQRYYALDGQHRLKSIQEAIRINPELAKEEITVIILKHEETREGLERTRRLFSTLNRRAKATSDGLNIAIDEDDSVAIVSRQLVTDNPLLKRLVKADIDSMGSKQIGPGAKNDPFITTLPAFYEVNEILLAAYDGGLNIDNSFKQFRKSYKDLDDYQAFLDGIWMLLLENCPGFKPVLEQRRLPGDLRRDDSSFDDSGKPNAGGSIFARPIGQAVVAEVVKIALLQGHQASDVVMAIMKNVSMHVDDAPWANVIWQPLTKKIQGAKSERHFVSNIICYALGLKIKDKVSVLKKRYRDTVQDPKASLLPPIKWSGRKTIDESEDSD